MSKRKLKRNVKRKASRVKSVPKKDKIDVNALREVLHQRSRKVYNPDKVQRAHVIGVGGIGTWVAIDLAMAGVRQLHIYDSDELAIHNLNRLPFRLNDVGRRKTAVVAKFIEPRRPDTQVVQHGVVMDANDLKEVKDGDVVVICVDSATENNKVIEILKGRNVQIIRGAYNEDRVTVMNAGYQWDEGPPGYGGVPSYVAPPQVVAGLILEKIYRNVSVDVNAIPLSKLGAEQTRAESSAATPSPDAPKPLPDEVAPVSGTLQ